MSLYDSCSDIHIVVKNNQTILFANAENADGDSYETSIDLDEVIGNDDGKLLYYP